MIYVFKTSVETEKDIQRLKPCLNKVIPLAKWTFDLDDCDKILRVDTPAGSPETIIRTLQDTGFNCEELAY